MVKKINLSSIFVVLSMLCGINLCQILAPITAQETCGVFFDFQQKPIYQKEYTLLGGEAELSFDFTAFQPTDVDNSGIYVTVDDKEVVRVPLKSSGQNIQVKMVLTKGKRIFKFIPYGTNNVVSTVLIKKIILKEKQCTPGWTNNLIVNGDFEQGTCASDVCYFSTKDFQPNYLPGWIPNPEIEIVKGSIYFPKLGNTKVAEVDAQMNSCFKQKVSLKAGKYLLTFNHQAFTIWGAALSTSGLQVKMDGLVLKTITPTNFENIAESLEFDLTLSCTDHELEFCAIGTSDKLGSGIDNVKLVYFSDCATEKIVEY